MEKIAIISDVHGNLEALNAAFDEFDRIGITKIICLGDVASFNADQINCMELIANKSNTIWIAGNHDLIAANLLAPIGCSPGAYHASMKARKLLPKKWKDYIRDIPLTYEIKEHNILAFHASLLYVDQYLSTEQKILNTVKILEKENSHAKYIFFGHTHKAAVYKYDGNHLESLQSEKIYISDSCTYLINVGTLGEPRTDKKNLTFSVFNVSEQYIETVTKEYPFAISYKKSLKSRTRIYSTLALYKAKIRYFLLRVRHKLIKLKNDDSSLISIAKRRKKKT